MLAWDDIKDEFALEGSFRDICILETTISDWQAVWSMLQNRRLDMTYTVDGVESAPPDNVMQIFAVRRDHTCMLAILVAGAQLNCHFFDESEVEFDLDPRQISGQGQLNAIVSFMVDLATTTAKVTLMTPENVHEAPFLRVSPSAATEYISTGGYFREAADQWQQHSLSQKRGPTSS